MKRGRTAKANTRVNFLPSIHIYFFIDIISGYPIFAYHQNMSPYSPAGHFTVGIFDRFIGQSVELVVCIGCHHAVGIRHYSNITVTRYRNLPGGIIPTSFSVTLRTAIAPCHEQTWLLPECAWQFCQHPHRKNQHSNRVQHSQ